MVKMGALLTPGSHASSFALLAGDRDEEASIVDSEIEVDQAVADSTLFGDEKSATVQLGKIGFTTVRVLSVCVWRDDAPILPLLDLCTVGAQVVLL